MGQLKLTHLLPPITNPSLDRQIIGWLVVRPYSPIRRCLRGIAGVAPILDGLPLNAPALAQGTFISVSNSDLAFNLLQ